jgi:hypothetical protein
MTYYFSLLWALQAVIALVLSAPLVFLGRKRVHWKLWEMSALVCPYATWLVLFLSRLVPSYELNAIGDSLLIGLSVPVAAVLRVVIGARFAEERLAIALLCALCFVAAGIYFMPHEVPHDSM